MDTPRREVFSVAEVAEVFGVSDNTIYRWAQSGDVRTIRLGTRRILFPRQEIERILGVVISDDATPSNSMQQVAA
jgi:excisionase family DNA binding protein